MSVSVCFLHCGDLPNHTLCVSDSWSDRTPLHEAAYQGRLLHLRSLIAQVNLLRVFLHMYTHNAQHICGCIWQCCPLWSPLQGFHVDTLTMDRISPLHEACLGGHYACAKFLLDNGANVRTQSVFSLKTGLFLDCLWSKAGGMTEQILNKKSLKFDFVIPEVFFCTKRTDLSTDLRYLSGERHLLYMSSNIWES